MQEHQRSQSVSRERCVLARLISPSDAFTENPLDEITGLAESAGTAVLGGVVQRRETPAPKTFLGKGKVSELRQMVELHSADVVIFDNNLSPSQTRNLEKETGTKVIDRTELILDIFASNARTREARLAVELAQLEYSLPRLKRLWTHLSRQTMGVGMRGPGEKQLEVDRRLVEKRIHELKQDLSKVEKRKEREVAGRRDFLTVSLVGYTNAGKSTLMNVLTEADVEAVDKLFATLDTRTRRWTLPSWGPVLLSDTVGFIRDLPHNLVASFRATLEEAREADLLLHVADASNPAVFDQISAVYGVLHELGIDEKQTLLVINKIDVPGAAERMQAVQNRYPHSVGISAKSQLGLDSFAKKVSQALSEGFVTLSIRLDVADGKTMAWLAKAGEVVSKQFHDDHVEIHARMPVRHAGKLAREGHQFEVLRGRLPDPKPEVETWEERLPTTGSILPTTESSELENPVQSCSNTRTEE
ncbi:GTPase HflX [Aureliella helgolandensis]|uniref:GTPase HflX n=1 Tax=Aureliella helgolandensis TaxID=2527968 RepID=A0A518GDA7_9BACT|nr:GTPase HflX [Aureliella helgolandensis]QDV26585.1 GTPase HflX [Aureliella helgolandensis]